jgi:hypothetical protein
MLHTANEKIVLQCSFKSALIIAGSHTATDLSTAIHKRQDKASPDQAEHFLATSLHSIPAPKSPNNGRFPYSNTPFSQILPQQGIQKSIVQTVLVYINSPRTPPTSNQRTLATTDNITTVQISRNSCLQQHPSLTTATLETGPVLNLPTFSIHDDT